METPRRASRVLLVDGSNRVLLFRGFDTSRPDAYYWFTPGGGLGDAEAPAVGAARELREETGLALTPADLGDPVHHEITRFSFAGVAYRQEQEFFLVRVPAWEVSTDGFDSVERGSIDDYRWWSTEELRATTELFYPRDLVQVLERVL